MKRLDWITVEMTPNEVLPLQVNPRKISEAKMAKLIDSINKFGFVTLAELDFDNTLLSGHQRIKALQAIGKGDEKIEFRKANRKLTDKEVKEWNLMANSHFGEFDNELLEEFFSDVDFEGLGLEELKFDLDNFVLNSLDDVDAKEADNSKTVAEAVEDDYEVPEVEEIKTDIVVGDLFEIGEHRLLCGDSTKREDVERLMNGEKADMVFTDPPYEIDFNYNLIKEYSENCHIFIFNNDRAIIRQLQLSPFLFKGFFIFYHSGTAIPQEGGHEVFLDHVLVSHEINGKPKVRYNKGMGTRTVIKGEYRRQKSHKHEKPASFLSPILSGYSNKEFIILDCFAGGGKLYTICEQLNRKCYGMELDPKYCQVIVDRMRKLDPDLVIKKNGEVI